MTTSTKAVKTVKSPIVAKPTKVQVAAAVAASDVTPKEFIIGPNKVTSDTKLKYKANPKRKNSKAWSRYEQYQKAKTFADYQKLNADKQSIPDLKYDFSKGFVEFA